MNNIAADHNSAVLWIIIGLVVLAVHFLPSYLAYGKNHPSKGLILILNILMGWTVIGWIALMVWVTSKD